MRPDLSGRVQSVSGSLERALTSPPLVPFAPDPLAFLAALSGVIMKDRAARRMPDLVSFGYWCRRANLERMAARYRFESPVVGRGVVLHIPPSNVPLNFAYSLVCGLLSGNSNIVRMSSVEAFEVDQLVSLMDAVLLLPEHSAVRDRVCLLRYGHDDEITSVLSAEADVRVIWGGDRTVSHIKGIPAKPRTVDVAFADRVSLCLLDAPHVAALDGEALRTAAERFYVDGYTFSQNACSSPRLVVWRGDDETVSRAQEKFWSAVDDVAEYRAEIEPIHVMNRLVEMCQMLATSGGVDEVTGLQSAATRVALARGANWQELSSLRFGTFTQVVVREVAELGALVDPNVQTLGHLGFGAHELDELVAAVLGRGVDRVVPLGTALEFDLVWDGYDMIHTLTRTVTVDARA